MPQGVDFGAAIGAAIRGGVGAREKKRDREFEDAKLKQQERLQQLSEDVRLLVAQLEEGGRNTRHEGEIGARETEETGRNTRHAGELALGETLEEGRNTRASDDLISREWSRDLDRGLQRELAERGSADSRYAVDQRTEVDRDRLASDIWRVGMQDNTQRLGQALRSATQRRDQDRTFEARAMSIAADPFYEGPPLPAPTVGNPWNFDESPYEQERAPGLQFRSEDMETYDQLIKAAQSAGDFDEMRRLAEEARKRAPGR